MVGSSVAKQSELGHNRLIGNPQQGCIIDAVQNMLMPQREMAMRFAWLTSESSIQNNRRGTLIAVVRHQDKSAEKAYCAHSDIVPYYGYRNCSRKEMTHGQACRRPRACRRWRAEVVRTGKGSEQTFDTVKFVFPRGDATSLLFGFDADGKITGIAVGGMAGTSCEYRRSPEPRRSGTGWLSVGSRQQPQRS